MANLRDIRNRIESIQNTKQITRAMKMVAAAKLRKAQDRILDARPYATKMQEIVARVVASASEEDPLLKTPDATRQILFIVIGSDRGLCGAFNNNLFKKVENEIEENFAELRDKDALSMITIGRKATKFFKKQSYPIIRNFPGFFENLRFGQVSNIMKSVITSYKKDTYDEVYIAFNEFASVISQNRIIEKVLPIDPELLNESNDEEMQDESIDYIFEPDANSILQELLPLHIYMQMWRAVLESNAAEQGARMTSMDNATENAEDLQDDLQLEYNRARQSAITTEISEIISGAQALEDA